MLRLESIIGLHHAAPQSMLIYLKNKRTEFDKMEPYGLSTLATIVAQFGDCRQNRRLLPFLATVAEFGNSRRFWQQSPNWATNCRRNRRL